MNQVDRIEAAIGAANAIHLLGYHFLGDMLRRYVSGRGKAWTSITKIEAQRWYAEKRG
jgi:hypothetical protein